jgi:superfamily II DNA/RNA helicase
MRNDGSSLPTVNALRQRAVPVRCVRYLHEKELIADDAYLTHSMNFTRSETERNTQLGNRMDEGVDSASDSFLQTWDQLESLEGQRGQVRQVAASSVVPGDWLPLLEHQTLNPFQSDIVPAVLAAPGHVVVVAPTGAGKSLIGELAVLRAVRLDRRKAVWLVPARALAAELGRLGQRWMKHGITVESLTGDANLSSARLRKADVWIATTEKFESLCRRSTLAEAVADVACIVVDEIHLVGDPNRGATLEALLARLRLLSDSTRVVGLSATVANAGEIAEWLGAELLQSSWRPTVLITQMISYTAESEAWADVERAKDEVLIPIVNSLLGRPRSETAAASQPRSGMEEPALDDAETVDPGSVLVFVGSKRTARALACRMAGVSASADEQQTAKACLAQGVGFHYRGAPLADDALQRFRKRSIRVLVATSGLSTGVNTPARAVIVRDLQLGQSDIEVSQIQQMFGRAGRAGLESEGYAYLLYPDGDRRIWQERLTSGYHVSSKLSAGLADAALAEVHLGNIASVAGLDRWFAGTFAAHQSVVPASAESILEQLRDAGLVESDELGLVAATELGRLTARLMVGIAAAEAMLANLKVPIPVSADSAELQVLHAIVSGAGVLAVRPVNPHDWEPIVVGILRRFDASHVEGPFGARLSLAGCLLALHEPQELDPAGRGNSGRMSALRDAVDEAPRFLTWAGELGRLGYADWQSVVASDLAERLTSWSIRPKPERGSGRVLRFVRSLVDPEDSIAFLTDFWPSASSRKGPQELHSAPIDTRVVALSRDSLMANCLTPGQPSYVLDGIGMRVETGIVGSFSRLDLRVNGGLEPVRASTSQGGPLSMPVPPGSGRSGSVGFDVVAFSRSDCMYSGALLAITVTESEGDTLVPRLANARRALADAQEVTSVTGRQNRGQHIQRGPEEIARQELLHLATLDLPLTGVAGALTTGLDPVAAVWTLHDAFTAMCPSLRGEAAPRTPLTVLRSGKASHVERAITLHALARAARMTAALVQVQYKGRTTIHCVVRLSGEWTVLATSRPAGSVSWLLGSGTADVTALPRKPAPVRLAATQRMSWLEAFVTNRIPGSAGT